MPPRNARSLLINANARYLYPGCSLISAASSNHSMMVQEHLQMSQLFWFDFVGKELFGFKVILGFDDYVCSESLRPC